MAKAWTIRKTEKEWGAFGRMPVYEISRNDLEHPMVEVYEWGTGAESLARRIASMLNCTCAAASGNHLDFCTESFNYRDA